MGMTIRTGEESQLNIDTTETEESKSLKEYTLC